LKDISVTQRGWTLDVLNIVRRLCEVGTPRRGVRGRLGPAVPTNTFTTADVYAFERELEKLHPDNRHVRDKIRQQLQVLRDAGLLQQVERGIWRLP
jgi:type II restriction enzyme